MRADTTPQLHRPAPATGTMPTVDPTRPVAVAGPARPERDGFGLYLAGIVVAAAFIRIVFTVFAEDLRPALDVDRYRQIGHFLADGMGFSVPSFVGPLPTASVSPGMPTFLGILERVGLDGTTGPRIVLSLLAAIGVGLVGLLGRRLGGFGVGLAAAAIAAVHPLWYQAPGLGVADALLLVLVPACLLAAVVLVDRPTYVTAALLGACLGALTLVRSDGILFVVALGVPAGLVAGRSWRARLRATLTVLVVAALVVGPWIARNEAELDGRVLTTNVGYTLAGSWCGRAFTGASAGSFVRDCADAAAAEARESEIGEVGVDRALIDRSQDFAADRLQQVPGVVVARLERLAGLNLSDQLEFDVAEGRHRDTQRLGQVAHLVLVPFAIAGVVLGSRRKWGRWFVLLAGPAVAVAVAVVFYGSTRLRVPAEPAIAVFAAAGMVHLVRRWRGVSTTDLDGLGDGTTYRTGHRSPAMRWLRRRTRAIRWKFRQSL